jgi:hypothetical protein
MLHEIATCASTLIRSALYIVVLHARAEGYLESNVSRARLPRFAGCPMLRTLNLQFCECSDAGVAAIAGNGALTTLSVDYGFHVSDAAICHAAVQCARLQHITLKNSAWLTDAALNGIGQQCPQLRYCRLNQYQASQTRFAGSGSRRFLAGRVADPRLS